MIRTYSQMHRTDKYSQQSSIIWPVWRNGWVFVYKLNGFRFESRCSHLNFRFCACFEKGVPWHSGNYWEWIHSETRTWHDKKIQLNTWCVVICFRKITTTIFAHYNPWFLPLFNSILPSHYYYFVWDILNHNFNTRIFHFKLIYSCSWTLWH